MPSKTTFRAPTPSTAHIDELLDEALRQTFPASDPIAIAIEQAGTDQDVKVAKTGTAAGELRRSLA